MAEAIEVSVERLTYPDYRSAQSVLLFEDAPAAVQKPTAGRNYLGWFLFIGIAAAMFLYLQTAKADKRPPIPSLADAGISWPVIAIIGGYIWIVVAFYVIISIARRQTPHTPLRFLISDDGVVVETPGVTRKWKWEAFDTVAETEGVFVLRFCRSQGLVVPKRGLVDPNALEKLRQLILRRKAAPVAAEHHAFEVIQ